MWKSKKKEETEEIITTSKEITITAENDQVIKIITTWQGDIPFERICEGMMQHGVHLSDLGIHIKVKKIAWDIEEKEVIN